MKILFINTTCGLGSHGRICGELAEEYEKQGYECKIAYGRGCSAKYSKFGKSIGNNFSIYLEVLNTRLFDKHGLGCKLATKKFLNWASEFNPDILWLHNIHGYYINYELLFDWIKSRPQMIVKWTLHDCWAFTGHCAFFTIANCNKWESGCKYCPIKNEYPKSIFIDNCISNYLKKKAAFTGITNLTLITPSQWLADLAKKSYLKEYPVEVQNNKVDLEVFKPSTCDFRKRYKVEDKTIILGVANVWHRRKGLDDFIELARMLDDKYVIVLVGFTSKQIGSFKKRASYIHRFNGGLKNVFKIDGCKSLGFDKYTVIKRSNNGVAISPCVYGLYQEVVKGIESNCSGTTMILLDKTNSVQELAGLYSTADFFINPTHEDNFPTTNLEAQACGTYVITYDVGGSKETIK